MFRNQKPKRNDLPSSAASKDPPSQRLLVKYAQAYGAAYENRASWLVRKVARYELTDVSSVKYTFSYDIDYSCLFSYNLEEQCGQMVVPLDMLARQPFISVSLRAPQGAEICLATRRENSRISCYIVFGMLAEKGVDLYQIPQNMIDMVFDFLVGNQNIYTYAMLAEFNAAAASEKNEPIDESSLSWRHWVRNASFRNQITLLVETYHLCVSMPAQQEVKRGVLKVTWIDSPIDFVESLPAKVRTGNVRRPRKKDRIRKFCANKGIVPPVIEISDILESDVSLHYRLTIPSGMRVEAVSPAYDGMIFRKSGGVMSLYRRKTALLPETTPGTSLRVYMNVKRALFTFPALIGSLVALSVVCAISFGRLPGSSASGGSDAVTIAALLPALIASYVALNDEHESLSVALGFRRLLLILGVLGAVLFSLIVSTWGKSDALSEFQCDTIFATILLEWTLCVFFAFEVGRVETWRHRWTRAHRNVCLVILTVVAMVIYFVVVVLVFSRQPWSYVLSNL